MTVGADVEGGSASVSSDDQVGLGPQVLDQGQVLESCDIQIADSQVIEIPIL
jgi:hypothetical protein